MNNDILDQPESKPDQKLWMVVGGVAVGLLALGLLMRFMLWPWAFIPIGLSLVLMAIRSIALFRSSRRNPTAWLYIIGHAFLVVALVLFYTGMVMYPGIFMLPAMAYLAGLIMADKKSEASD